jgi:hypothetical protein
MRACIHGDVVVAWQRPGRAACPLCQALKAIGKYKQGKRVEAAKDGNKPDEINGTHSVLTCGVCLFEAAPTDGAPELNESRITNHKSRI